jgi:uncharacterized paraquat-inducible protein A
LGGSLFRVPAYVELREDTTRSEEFVMTYQKKFHCTDCKHTFEQVVLETVTTAMCPKCRQWVGLLRYAQNQGLTFGQTAVIGLILYAIFG